MQVSTTRFQRIAIWIIGIVLVVGTLGAYFFIIVANNQPAANQTQSANQSTTTKGETVDPTAYRVSGKVTELQVIDERTGTGDAVKAGDSVKVNYKGTIAQTGVLFDSSYDRGEPISFPLSNVIKGWQDGLVGMQVGGKRRLVIPSDLAYGAQAQQGIPANSDLVFEVELLAINPAQ